MFHLRLWIFVRPIKNGISAQRQRYRQQTCSVSFLGGIYGFRHLLSLERPFKIADFARFVNGFAHFFRKNAGKTPRGGTAGRFVINPA